MRGSCWSPSSPVRRGGGWEKRAGVMRVFGGAVIGQAPVELAQRRRTPTLLSSGRRAPPTPGTGSPPGALSPAPRTGAGAAFSARPDGGRAPRRLRIFRHHRGRARVHRRAVVRSLSSEDRRVLSREGNGPGFPPASTGDGYRGLLGAAVRPRAFGADLPDVPPGRPPRVPALAARPRRPADQRLRATGGLDLGSGDHARTYLCQTPGGETFQLPLAWYSQIRGWGMAPGFDRPDHEGVLRRVRRECLPGRSSTGGEAVAIAGRRVPSQAYSRPGKPDGDVPAVRLRSAAGRPRCRCRS
jgi:hypothetical protein